MDKLNQIYRCNVCGNIVELVHRGAGTLVCCGEDMEEIKANATDGATEKHVPIIEKTGAGVIVKVGEVPHPMEEAHYIEWIEIMVDGKVDRQHLKPSDKPEAKFNIDAPTIIARAYCNLHGLWKSL